MRKYTAVVWALSLGVVLLTAGNVGAQAQIGTVDLQRVRNESPEFKRALREIDAMVKDFERRGDRQRRELEELSEDFRDAQRRGLTGSAERLQSRLQEKSVKYQEFMEEAFGTEGIVETNSAEQLKPLYDKLAEAAENIGKHKGLDLILDLETVNPLFAADRLDVTDDVLEEFARLK